MNNEELLGKIAEYFVPITKDMALIKKTLSQMQSVDEALKAGQDDIREKLDKKADKIDIQRLEKKQDKNNVQLQDHEERIEALEEEHRNSRKN